MQDELKKAFKYQDGNLIWVKTGKVAGCVNTRGYRMIKFKNQNYLGHRLVWYFYYGNWPRQDIDHIDGNKLNNEINNLRDVSTSDNCGNQVKHRNGKLVGCYFHRQSKLWHSSIRKEGKVISLGYFKTELEAHKMYVNFKGLNNG